MLTGGQYKTPIDSAIDAILRLEWLIFGIWLVLIVWVNTFHELWRDEARALWFAIDAPSLTDLLLGRSERDHHPVLWHLVLRLGYDVTGNYMVLRIGNIAFVAAAVSLVLFKSPFPWWIRFLFPFGIFPLYEYGVIARSYGMAMFLLLAAAALHRERMRWPVAYGSVLALLANATHHTLIFACLLALLWGADALWSHRSEASARSWATVAGFLIFGAAVAYCLLVTWPDPTQQLVPFKVLNLGDVAKSVGATALDPSRPLDTLFPLEVPAWLRNVVLGLALIGLWRRPSLLFLAIAALFLFGMLGDLAYPTPFRHDGLYGIFLLSLYWIRLSENGASPLDPILSWTMMVTATAILIAAIAAGYTPILLDVRGSFSASRDLGRFLAGDPGRQTAIILPEPTFITEALPNYAPNRVFLAREGRFSKTPRFVRSVRADFSLGELVDVAEQLAQRERVPVYIILSLRFADQLETPGTYPAGLTGRFSWTSGDSARFRDSTTLVARFGSIGDENYAVYKLNP